MRVIVYRKLAISETNVTAPALEAQPVHVALDVQYIRVTRERLVCLNLFDGFQVRAEETCEACDTDT